MQTNKKTLIILGVIFVAALTRLIPHPMNFAPLGAMALFGSAYFGRKGLGLVLTMLAWFVSDLVLNNFVYGSADFTLFTQGALFIYGSILLIYLAGSRILRKVNIQRALIGSLSASVIFFLVSNFGVWVSGTMYPMSLEGITACYVAAIPFFQNTLLGDLVYTGALFLAYERILRANLIPGEIKG